MVNEAIAAEVADPTFAPATQRAASLVADAELAAFVVQHERASIELVRAAASRLGGSRPRLSATAWTPFSMFLGEAQDEVLEELADVVDQVVLLPRRYVEHNARLAAIAARGTPALELSMLLTRLSPPVPGAAALTTNTGPVAQELQAAATLGVNELSLYNYGLLRKRDVSEFVTTVRTAFP